VTEPSEPRVVEAATGSVETAETDTSRPPEPVPDGFPRRRPAHVQVRVQIPEGGGGEPVDAGAETQPGKATDDRDTADGEENG
jgi:hypothetical protein